MRKEANIFTYSLNSEYLDYGHYKECRCKAPPPWHIYYMHLILNIFFLMNLCFPPFHLATEILHCNLTILLEVLFFSHSCVLFPPFTINFSCQVQKR